MISVSIWRKTLERLNACAGGLAAFDALCALQPKSDARRAKRFRVTKWTPLHAVWIRAVYPGFSSWLEEHDLIPRANLQGAYLRGADLRGADLRRADLTGANLRGADLRRADLQGAYLQGADLEGADLRRADLEGAYLQGADLEGAYLEGAYRGASDAPAGWSKDASGYLARSA